MPRCFTCVALFLTVLSAGDASLPDFVVFLSDDHGHLNSTPYGATEVRAPQMQRLADDGIVFTHAFIASPACAPSRAALFTGLMPARNGAENNHTYNATTSPRCPTHCAHSAAFGKVAHSRTDAARHGFDVHEQAKTDATAAALVQRYHARPALEL